MYCKTRYWVRDLNCLSSQDFVGGGGDIKFLHYPGRGFKRGHRQMAWGRELKRGKPTPYLAGGVFINFMKTPIRNYQCTLVGIKNSNDWKISKEKSKLEILNVHIRKAKFSKEKCTYWKSK